MKLLNDVMQQKQTIIDPVLSDLEQELTNHKTAILEKLDLIREAGRSSR